MKNKIEFIADHYGLKNQLNKTVEELGELITAISRYNADRHRVCEVVEEIADVEIMLEQLKYLLDIKNDVNFMKTVKTVRQIERIKGAE